MEFRLNKIDTEIRNDINEKTREGKIHSKENIEVNSQHLNNSKRRNKDNHKKKKKEPFSISKYAKGKRSVEVTAYKSESIEVNVEKQEERNNSTDKGLFIDIRR